MSLSTDVEKQIPKKPTPNTALGNYEVIRAKEQIHMDKDQKFSAVCLDLPTQLCFGCINQDF